MPAYPDHVSHVTVPISPPDHISVYSLLVCLGPFATLSVCLSVCLSKEMKFALVDTSFVDFDSSD